jgi:hypothetical protein
MIADRKMSLGHVQGKYACSSSRLYYMYEPIELAFHGSPFLLVEWWLINIATTLCMQAAAGSIEGRTSFSTRATPFPLLRTKTQSFTPPTQAA